MVTTRRTTRSSTAASARASQSVAVKKTKAKRTTTRAKSTAKPAATKRTAKPRRQAARKGKRKTQKQPRKEPERPKTPLDHLTKGGVSALQKDQKKSEIVTVQILQLLKFTVDAAFAATFNTRLSSSYAYDVIVSDGEHMLKCLLHPSQYGLIEHGDVSEHDLIDIASFTSYRDETVLVRGAPYTLLREIRRTPDTERPQSTLQHARPPTYPSNLRSMDNRRITSLVPLIGSRRTYVDIDSDDTLRSDLWQSELIEPDKQEKEQLSKRVNLRENINGYCNAKRGKPFEPAGPLVARVTRICGINYYGKPTDTTPCPCQFTFFITDDSLLHVSSADLQRWHRERGSGLIASANEGSSSSAYRPPSSMTQLRGGHDVPVVVWNALVLDTFESIHVGDYVVLYDWRIKANRANPTHPYSFEFTLNASNPAGFVRKVPPEFLRSKQLANMLQGSVNNDTTLYVWSTIGSGVRSGLDNDVFDVVGLVTYVSTVEVDFVETGGSPFGRGLDPVADILAPSEQPGGLRSGRSVAKRTLRLYDPFQNCSATVVLYSNSHVDRLKAVQVGDILSASRLRLRSITSDSTHREMLLTSTFCTRIFSVSHTGTANMPPIPGHVSIVGEFREHLDSHEGRIPHFEPFRRKRAFFPPLPQFLIGYDTYSEFHREHPNTALQLFKSIELLSKALHRSQGVTFCVQAKVDTLEVITRAVGAREEKEDARKDRVASGGSSKARALPGGLDPNAIISGSSRRGAAVRASQQIHEGSPKSGKKTASRIGKQSEESQVKASEPTKDAERNLDAHVDGLVLSLRSINSSTNDDASVSVVLHRLPPQSYDGEPTASTSQDAGDDSAATAAASPSKTRSKRKQTVKAAEDTKEKNSNVLRHFREDMMSLLSDRTPASWVRAVSTEKRLRKKSNIVTADDYNEAVLQPLIKSSVFVFELYMHRDHRGTVNTAVSRILKTD